MFLLLVFWSSCIPYIFIPSNHLCVLIRKDAKTFFLAACQDIIADILRNSIHAHDLIKSLNKPTHYLFYTWFYAKGAKSENRPGKKPQF